MHRLAHTPSWLSYRVAPQVNHRPLRPHAHQTCPSRPLSLSRLIMVATLELSTSGSHAAAHERWLHKRFGFEEGTRPARERSYDSSADSSKAREPTCTAVNRPAGIAREIRRGFWRARFQYWAGSTAISSPSRPDHIHQQQY